MKYRRKEQILDALHWQKSTPIIDVIDLVGSPRIKGDGLLPPLKIKTYGGILTVDYGDYIIKDGESIWICQPHRFEPLFKKVEEKS